MTQYTLVINRAITKCEPDPESSVDVTVTAAKVLDERQRYVLDSPGIWATSDITSNLAADGTNTSLNAHSENAAGQVISNLISLAAQIIPLAAAAPPAEGEPTSPPSPITCSEKVRSAILELVPKSGKTLKQLVEDDTTALNAATATLNVLAAQASKDRSYNRRLADAIGRQGHAQATLTADQARLSKLLKDISVSETRQWPLNSDEIRADHAFRIDPNSLAKLLMVPEEQFERQRSKFDVSLALYVHQPDGRWVSPGIGKSGDTDVGVPVRLGRTGRFLVCTGDDACPKEIPVNAPPNEAQRPAFAPDQPVLQLGTMYNIRVRGGLFKSEGAVIALDSNGLPTSIQVSEKAAVADAATGSAVGAATQIAAIPGQVAAAELARTQARTQQITAENALAAARASSRTAASTAAASSETALLNAQAALATAQANAAAAGPIGIAAAQTATINAQNALLVAEGSASVAKQLSGATAQTTLLNAQAAQINAQVALVKAQAALNQ
ncbi:hypothetical protein JHL17_08670 [Azospirillum sp. YIM B02556]|uniref:Uncharacterized protein n=1 Tax=Azospirillum endophyticum TaxID=2800326 RepID=A0ABS1F281_9PROT|nr:hypothetical protein [Azospirillum endophyticum]MBK1837484.1 hypothetical protein [Azospirillum endophyticum]